MAADSVVPDAATEFAPQFDIRESGDRKSETREVVSNVPDVGSKPAPARNEAHADWLSPFELSETTASAFVPSARASNKGCLPMFFAEYLDLLDWTGRQLRADKRGAIPQDLAPILDRLQISGEGWMQLMGQFSRLFRRAAGRPHPSQKRPHLDRCRRT